MTDGVHETRFKANPIQNQFIRSQARADFWCTRMGEGKSAALAWCSFYHTRHNPGAVWAVIRDTWENLRDTTQEEFFKWFPPGIYGTYHHTNKEYTWAEGVAKGKVKFLGMDDPDDVSKLQSRKIDGFAFDEPAPALNSGGIPETVFDVALSRARDPGMQWYPVKLAANNPDESHWTYKRFVDPGTEGFRYHQSARPENEKNLRQGYYAELRRQWAHRPDFIKRFVDGKFGYSQQGKAVTPQWNDEFHLATGLSPLPGVEVVMLWDWGLNPTCVITQVTPMRQWLILDAMVGEDIGVEELIETEVKPLLATKYKRFGWWHIGDPAGENREQSTSKASAVRTVLKMLGGRWRAGPKSTFEGVEPLRAVLSRNNLVQVDRNNARAVWMALRGGWHYHVARTGVVSTEPVKNIHSHPGDAMRYGAAVLFPMALKSIGRARGRKAPVATYFGNLQPHMPPKPVVTQYPGRIPRPGQGLTRPR